jgi:hypothetical protein
MAPSPIVLSSQPIASIQSKIAVLAGRRPDAVGQPIPRFPLARVPAVQQELTRLFQAEEFTTLVCAAACGADLLALQVALELGLTAHVVLPFDPTLFRRTSVVDRPGNWGPSYDLLIAHAKRQHLLTVLHLPEGEQHTYEQGNDALIAKAQELSLPTGPSPTSVVVWDGASRGADDVTQHFRQACQRAGFREHQLLTKEPEV